MFLAKNIQAFPERYCLVKQLKAHQSNPNIYEIIQDKFRG